MVENTALNRTVGVLDAVSGGLMIGIGVLMNNAGYPTTGMIADAVGGFYVINGISDAVTGNEHHLFKYLPRSVDLIKRYRT